MSSLCEYILLLSTQYALNILRATCGNIRAAGMVGCQTLPKVAKGCQSLPKVAKVCQRLPKKSSALCHSAMHTMLAKRIMAPMLHVLGIETYLMLLREWCHASLPDTLKTIACSERVGYLSFVLWNLSCCLFWSHLLQRSSPVQVSDRAKKRGKTQLGTLGAGNHYVEVQVSPAASTSPICDKLGCKVQSSSALHVPFLHVQHVNF